MAKLNSLEETEHDALESEQVEATPVRKRLPLVTRADVNINVSRIRGNQDDTTSLYSPVDDGPEELTREHLDILEETENSLAGFIPGEKEAIVMDAILTRASGMKTTEHKLNFS